MTHFALFPRPGESDPLYGVTSHGQLKFVFSLTISEDIFDIQRPNMKMTNFRRQKSGVPLHHLQIQLWVSYKCLFARNWEGTDGGTWIYVKRRQTPSILLLYLILERKTWCQIPGNYFSLRCLGQASSQQSLLWERPQTSHWSWLCQSDQEGLDECRF